MFELTNRTYSMEANLITNQDKIRQLMNENKRESRTYTEGKFATMLNKVHNDNADLRSSVDKSLKDLSNSLTIEVSDSSKELTKYWKTALHNLNETMFSHKSEHITKLTE